MRLRRWRAEGWRGLAACCLALSVCQRIPSGEGGGDEGSGDSSSATTTTGGGSSTDGATTPAGSSTTDGTTGETSDDSGGAFISTTDAGGNDYLECDVWEQDCPAGEKCLPWTHDPNDDGCCDGTKCVPLADDPGAIGEACTVDGEFPRATDDCAVAAICQLVEPGTDTGTCIGLCRGDIAVPWCEDPDAQCIAYADGGIFYPCVPRCDPLANDCPGQAGCTADGHFGPVCNYADGSRLEGEPCETAFYCAAGLACLDSSIWTDGEGTCQDGSGDCCVAWCDLTAPNDCPDAAGGQQCLPWPTSGATPNLGHCAYPKP